MTSNQHNPWAGLSSYQDPESSDVQLKFCGRDNESFDVAQLIDDNIFVTLYGKSGTGKTSLLNAGVFPRLRQDSYLPVSIRLGMDALGISFQQCIFTKIAMAMEGKGSIVTREVVAMPGDEQSQEYLWSYFARTQFLDAEGQVIFPAIVFDQFEEVFRTRREDTEVLLRQIYFMMDEGHALSDRTVDGQPYVYDFNFRFVVSIREDDLYRLEDSIDNNYLLDMKRCRFRLRNLSEEGARDAIFTPGGNLFPDDERNKIATTIIGIARNQEDRSISANILSLICNRIFVEFQRTGASHISLSLVDKFVKGNPFERFYNEATQGFSDREKSYIETHMVDSAGRRNSIAESDFLLHVRNGALLFEGNRKILQRTSTSSDGGNYRIELIHDSFCAPLAGLKEKRERRRKLKWLAYAIAFVIASIGIGVYLFNKNQELNKANEQLNKANEQLVASERELKQQKDNVSAANDRLKKYNRDLSIAKDSIQYTSLQLAQFNAQLRDKNEQLERQKQRAMQAEHERDSVSLQLKSLQNTSEKKIEILSNYDGIEFNYESPTKEQIEEWAQVYKRKCSVLIQEPVKEYTVSKEMLENDPCLVYMILKSKSMAEHSEKQNWFNLYSIMTEEQIDKLYDILYRESHKLEEINARYEKKQKEINEKYNQSESQ